jgi:hypothetical protein
MAHTPIDCKCKGKPFNEGRMPKHIVEKLQEPVILQFNLLKPIGHYEGNVTKIQYEFGSSLQFQCVDKRDVPFFLGLRRSGKPMFTVWKAPVETPEEADEETDTPPVGETDPLELLSNLKGVGESSAKKLFEKGYTISHFAALEPTDEEAIAKIAEDAGVSKGIVTRAIEGANQWLVDVNSQAD